MACAHVYMYSAQLAATVGCGLLFVLPVDVEDRAVRKQLTTNDVMKRNFFERVILGAEDDCIRIIGSV